MRRILIGLALVLIALPAWAQSKDKNWPKCKDIDHPDISIGACTAVIKSARIAPDIGLALAYRAISEIYKELYDDAIADSTKSLEFLPGNAGAYSSLGYSYEQKGQRDKAIANYLTALRLEPSDTNSKQGLERLGAAP